MPGWPTSLTNPSTVAATPNAKSQSDGRVKLMYKHLDDVGRLGVHTQIDSNTEEFHKGSEVQSREHSIKQPNMNKHM